MSPEQTSGRANGWSSCWKTGVFGAPSCGPPSSDVLDALAGVEVLAFDIPIGLPKGHDHRGCDAAAKVFVGRRSSSVFHTPPRAVLEAPTYREANRLSKELCGRGISAQAYALRAKILEVDPIAATDARIVEVHPEVSFCAMKGSTLEFSKKSWNGQMERRALLRSQRIELPDQLPGRRNGACRRSARRRRRRLVRVASPPGRGERAAADWRRRLTTGGTLGSGTERLAGKGFQSQQTPSPPRCAGMSRVQPGSLESFWVLEKKTAGGPTSCDQLSKPLSF